MLIYRVGVCYYAPGYSVCLSTSGAVDIRRSSRLLAVLFWSFPIPSITVNRMSRKAIPTPRLPSRQQIKDRFTKLSAWELPKQTSAIAPKHVWTNKDMDPVPYEDQTWTIWTWMA